MGASPGRIGRYIVDRELGRGAMGVVYKAHDPDIDRAVAVKLVRVDLLESKNRDDYLARFRREVQAAGRCLHPNIVAIYDFGFHEDSPFLVMEYVDAVPLDEALPKGVGLGAEAACAIVLQVLDALACAHGLGVVHRDVKPANILLGAGRRIKVMDFGISRISTSHLTQLGAVLGTPRYMSPEQVRGGPVDARSDLFSTGAVLHELLTGAPAYTGRSSEEVMVKLLYEDLELAPADAMMPEPLRAVVARALARNPDDRFESAAAMAAAVRQAAPHGADSGEAARTIVSVAPPGSFDPPPDARAAASFSSGPSGADSTLQDPELLATIQRRLAEHMGPIATLLMRNALREADSVDALCERLASNIEQPRERDRFLQDVRARLVQTPATRTGPSASTGGLVTGLSPEDIETAQRDLTRLLGPIAGVLVKRAALLASSPADLRARLAEHLDQPAERSAFLSGR